jgi:hypothetical protein
MEVERNNKSKSKSVYYSMSKTSRIVCFWEESESIDDEEANGNPDALREALCHGHHRGHVRTRGHGTRDVWVEIGNVCSRHRSGSSA